MKKLLIIATVVLAIAGFSLAILFPHFGAIANKDFPIEGDEPDLPGFLDKAKSEFSKEEFMTRRAEYIGLKRGIDKNKALPDPRVRQDAIAQMEAQQDRVAARPDSDEKR